MSPKEQSLAMQLLLQWYEAARQLPRALLPPDTVELLDKTEKFLHHGGGDGESHGQRRG